MAVAETPTDTRSTPPQPVTPKIGEPVRRDLINKLGREVLVDEVSRGIYATDASVWQFEPIAVVTPKNREDIKAVLEIARKHNVPVMPRGGGTSLAGQTANHAIVLDVSKYMNKIVELNAANHYVIVEPGLVRDELNAAIADKGLEFAPETSTSNRANIGGMIGNNSSGTRSIRYGRTIEHLLECTLMLPNGEVIECVPRTEKEIKELMDDDSEEGKIWRGFSSLIEKHKSLIKKKFPKVLRRVGGYSLDEFVKDGKWNLAKLVCGSEGTLGVMLDAKLNLVRTPKYIMMLAIHFDDLIGGLRTVPELLKHDPLSVELLDGPMLRLSKKNPSTIPHCGFIVGDPEVILTVELSADSEKECLEKLDKLESDLKEKNIGYAHPRFETKEECFNLLELRRKGLGVSLSVPGDTKPVSWIEDACVPVEHLADYTEKVLKAATDRGLDTVIYGHASVGVLHIKPALNLKTKKGMEDMASLSKTAMQYCREYGGSWSGEHGDGVARGAQNLEFWGQDMVDLFRQVKHLFDPKELMNPGRIIDTPEVAENLRYGDEYKVKDFETQFHYRDFGGFGAAVEMCNGVGACRKTLGGTMCPSYMATRDEQDSTRGRANALRLAMSGQFGKDGMANERVHEVLDLCLSCKACKSECPSNVDMARLKAEQQAIYYQKHSPSLRDRMFANAPLSGRMFSGPLSFFANAPLKIAPLRQMMLKFLGVAEKRNLPMFASQKLETWFKSRNTKEGERGEVAVFADCWSNYHELGPGKWAIRVMEELGYKVNLISNACCQRTRISKGFLDEAKRQGTETVQKLRPYAERGVPILCVEPSCASSITDDLPDLVDDFTVSTAKKVAEMTMPIEEFLQKEIESGNLDELNFEKPAEKIMVHGHCHQKAIYSTSPCKTILASGGAEVTEVDSGCCGMAGSFGYEAEHYDISKKIGERRILPAARDTDDDTVIVANGFSCRHQINDFADKKSYHTIEVIGRSLTGKWHTD